MAKRGGNKPPKKPKKSQPSTSTEPIAVGLGAAIVMEETPSPAPRPVPEKLVKLQESLTKRFGKNVLQFAAEAPDIFRLRRPSGIPALDVLLHGGFPAGGPSQIIGHDGTGKTDITWRVLAQAQKNYGSDYMGAIACVEHWPDKSQARFAGLQIAYSDEELGWIEKDTGAAIAPEEEAHLRQETGSTIFLPNENVEHLLDATADLYASGICQVIILDSIGAIMPENEFEKEFDDSERVGNLPMLMTRFMKKIHSASMRKLGRNRVNETTLIIINQYREKMQATQYEDPMRIQGGNALKHGKLVDLSLAKGAWIKAKDEKTKIGKVVKAAILKGKAGMHEGATGEWDFLFSTGADVNGSLLSLAMTHGLVTKGKDTYLFWDEEEVTGSTAAKLKCSQLSSHIFKTAYQRSNVPGFRVT